MQSQLGPKKKSLFCILLFDHSKRYYASSIPNILDLKGKEFKCCEIFDQVEVRCSGMEGGGEGAFARRDLQKVSMRREKGGGAIQLIFYSFLK